MSPLRGALANLGLLLGSVLVCLIGAELVLRGLAPAERHNQGRLFRLEPNPGYESPTLLPSTNAVHVGIAVKTNALGLRDREYAVLKPREALRVAFFGDSFTYGQGVELEEVFTERLEARLADLLGEGKVEVWNFGTSGFNTFQELLYYANYGRQFEPDLVVVIWVPFDHQPNGYRFSDFERFDALNESPPDRAHAREDRLAARGLARFYLRYLQPLYVVRFFGRRAKEALGILGLNMNRLEESELRAFDSEGHRLQFASLRKFKELAEAQGADFLLVIFPGLQRLDSDYYQELLYSKVEAFAAEHGIECLNLFPSFRGREPSELHVSLVDSHPNAKAHALAADVLFEFLYPRLASASR